MRGGRALFTKLNGLPTHSLLKLYSLDFLSHRGTRRQLGVCLSKFLDFGPNKPASLFWGPLLKSAPNDLQIRWNLMESTKYVRIEDPWSFRAFWPCLPLDSLTTDRVKRLLSAIRPVTCVLGVIWTILVSFRAQTAVPKFTGLGREDLKIIWLGQFLFVFEYFKEPNHTTFVGFELKMKKSIYSMGKQVPSPG